MHLAQVWEKNYGQGKNLEINAWGLVMHDWRLTQFVV